MGVGAMRNSQRRGWQLWHWLPLLALLCSLHGGAVAAKQNETPLDLATYLVRVRDAQAQLGAKPTATTLHIVQTQLNAIKSVALPGGETLVVQPLLTSATAKPLTVAEAQTRLTIIVDQLSAAPEDNTAARLAVLAAILQRPAFVGQESRWDRFWRWLRQWLPDLFREPESANGASWLGGWTTILGWVILAIAAVLLILLLSLWLQRLLAGFVQSDADRALGMAADAEPQTAAQARQQAQQLAGAGSFREAVRRMYLAALLTLHERNLLHYDRSNTNREVLATVRNQPALHAQLQPLVETFDDVWYGIHEPDRATFDRYVQAVKRLEEQA